MDGLFRRIGEGDSSNCFGKLNDLGKPPVRRLGILPQQLRTSPMFVIPFVRSPRQGAPFFALTCRFDGSFKIGKLPLFSFH